jgi:hypothetical protein
MSDDVSLELPRQNVTVVGSFNPAILQPHWIQRWVPEIKEEIATLMPLGGGAPIYQAGQLYWVVTPERLVVHGPPARTGRIAATILGVLVHTPLRAAGVNFSFQGQASREQCGPWRLVVGNDLGEVLRGEPADFSISQVVRREDGVRLTVKLAWPAQEPDAILDLNYHREAESHPAGKRAEELANHVERATEFESDANRIREALIRG